MIIVEGQKLKCKICGKDVSIDLGIVFAGVYEYNDNQPLSMFNDSIVHSDCLKSHSLKDKLYLRINILDELSKKNVTDYITGGNLEIENIGHPDNLIRFIYFTDDESDFLYKYNCVFINKQNLNDWKELPEVIRSLNELNNSSQWGGNAIQSLLNQLQSPITKAWSPEFIEKMKHRYNK
jgi:hypothetical protein